MNVPYRVELSQAERDELTTLLSKDESPVQLIGEVRQPIPAKPGGMSDILCKRLP